MAENIASAADPINRRITTKMTTKTSFSRKIVSKVIKGRKAVIALGYFC